MVSCSCNCYTGIIYQGVTVSDHTSSLIVLAVSLLALMLTTRTLDLCTLIDTPALFSLATSLYSQALTYDSVFHSFLLLFSTQLFMILGLLLYCDCPLATWLDLKIDTFYLATTHLLVSSSYTMQLLLFETVGMSSYRLIAHYSHRLLASRGAFISLATNKTGDLLFML